jgi:choice-of-anchor A domain-containing protein
LGYGEDAVNIVVFENAEASGCDVEGRMWVGENADLNGFGVGAQLTECDEENPVLVVGGDANVLGGVKGAIWVGGEYTGNAPQCGGILDYQPGPVDFPEVQDILTRYSALLAGYPVNGTASYEGTVLVLSGTDPDLNVVEITGDDLAGAGRIRIDAPLTSSFIVNVTGTSASFVGGDTMLPDGHTCGSGAVDLDDFCNQLIWNFPDTSALSVGGTAVQGSILAPHADLIASGSGQVNGTVIVANFEITSCIELHPHYFNGCLCTEELDSPYACCPPE